LGNTEVSSVARVSKLGREAYLKAWSGKRLQPGSSSWVFDPVRDVQVFGFDVTVDGKPHREASADGLKRHEKELTANADKKLIMNFTHQLLMPATSRDSSAEWSVWMARNHEMVRLMLGRYPNVSLLVSSP
jgi:hypothetical protein